MKSDEHEAMVHSSRQLTSWGFGNVHPKYFTCMNSSKWLLCTISMYFFVLSIVVNGIYSASIPDIEKRFSLSSGQLGIITSIYDVAALVVMLPVAYFGVRNRPRSLAVGMFLMAIGFVVFLLPHFLIEKYTPVFGTNGTNKTVTWKQPCTPSPSNTTDECHKSFTSSSTFYYALFLAGMTIAGVGVSPLVAIGIPMIDDRVKSQVSPLYIGLYNSSGVLGFGVGSALAFVFLRIFVNPGGNTVLQPGDSHWIGAWWIGFALGIVMALITSLALALLPRYSVSQISTNCNVKPRKVLANKLHLPAHDFGKHLKDLLMTRKSFLLISVWTSLQFLILTGGVAFLPKISSVQFRIPVGTTAVYLGFAIVLAGILGSIAGALMLKKCNGGGKAAIKLCLVFSLLSVVSGLYLFISCESTPVVGVDKFSPSRNLGSPNNSTCNSNCSCKADEFHLVCAGSETFLSPCFAGCKKQKSGRLFANCSCAQNYEKIAKLEACRMDCAYRPLLFFIGAGLQAAALCSSVSPAAIATLRSVPFELKAFALGLQWMLLRIFGSIPGPILVGYLIDASCLKWEKQCNGSRGVCQLYNNADMSTYVAVVFLIVQLIGIFFLAMALILHKESSNLTDVKGDTQDTALHALNS